MKYLYKDIESIHIWHNNKSDYSDMDTTKIIGSLGAK